MPYMAVLKIDSDESTTVLTLARPEVRNALSTELAKALSSAVREAESCGVASIVLTGSAPAFCGGSDLKELAELDPPAMAEHERATARDIAEIAQSRLPVVAAVEGFALGGGFALALVADVIVAARNARFHFPEVTNGWIPPWGLARLRRRVTESSALQLVWGVEPIAAVEAQRIGVVDTVCEPGAALETSLNVARRLASLPEHAVQDAKAAFERRLGLSDYQLSVAFERHVATADAETTLTRFRRN